MCVNKHRATWNVKQCARAKCVCTLANCCGCGGRIKNGLKHENPVFEKGLHSYIRCKPRNQRMQRHTTRCTGRKRNYSLAPSDCTVPGTTTALPIAAHRTNTVGHHNTRPLQTEVTGRKKTQYDLTTTPRHNPQCNACTGVICSPLLHWRRRRVPRRGVPHKEQQHPPHNKRQPAKDETRGRHHGQPHISLVNADANTALSLHAAVVLLHTWWVHAMQTATARSDRGRAHHQLAHSVVLRTRFQP